MEMNDGRSGSDPMTTDRMLWWDEMQRTMQSTVVSQQDFLSTGRTTTRTTVKNMQRKSNKKISHLWMVLLFTLGFTSRCCLAWKTKNKKAATPPVLECDLYLAESTIPNAGLGVFTAIEKKVGDTVGNGDVCFPVMELDWHNGLALDETADYHNPFEDYVWDGTTMGMGAECDSEVTALWPGLDCAINCNIPLVNVERAFPLHQSHEDEGLEYMPHRRKDPTAGSITPYRSKPTIVSRGIPVGGELFKFYGDTWFTTRPEIFEGLPLQTDFPKVQYLIEKYNQYFGGFQPLYDLMLDIQATWKSTSGILNALPQTQQDLKLALEQNVTHIYQANATRSLAWLQQHGKCLDHILHKPSTIPGAGEGAFAKRRLPQNTVITGTPLLHIPFRSLMDMYRFELKEDADVDAHTENGDDWDRFATKNKQVVMNYCFGHKDSTLLLFPYGSGVNYINHAPSGKANVKLQWAQHGNTAHNSSWLDMSPDEMEHKYGTHLGMDYIAIRDIEEGEELFLDYGSDWEDAWNQHVASWAPPEEISTAADWNTQFKDAPVLTWSEWIDTPYPESIQVRCHVNLADKNWRTKPEKQNWTRYVPHKDEYRMVYGLPCEILERSADDKAYKVQVTVDRFTFMNLPDDFNETRTGVPREAIFFMDAPYESDLYLENAFRHPIGIPDYMMPEAWKNNIANSAGSDEL